MVGCIAGEVAGMVGDFEKRFGTKAVEKRYVSREQLLEAMRIQVEQDLDGLEHKLIGSILFSMGYMTLEQINDVIDAVRNETGASVLSEFKVLGRRG
jgi:predicted nucleotide-binding protein (sugar kinase/HSP70/actin superfamily)